MFFKNCIRWLKEFWPWFLKAKIIGIPLIISVFFFAFYHFWPLEKSIKWVGFICELFGTIWAIKGLFDIRDHFDEPTIPSLIAQWWGLRPKWRRETIYGSCNLHSSGSTFFSAFAESWFQDNPNESLENRINNILRNVDQIREAQKKYGLQIGALEKNQEENKNEQAQSIENTKAQFDNKLKALHTDGVLDSIFGLMCVTVGMVMNTLSAQIAELLQCLKVTFL